MNRRQSSTRECETLIQEAARLICEEAVVDYRQARRKAAERLGIDPRVLGNSQDLSAIEAAVIEWQHLFGGEAYVQQLRLLRETAVKAMRLLAEFEPKLVGAVVSGAIGNGHRLQLHAFADKAEQLDIFLENRGIPFRTAEREFRFAGGGSESIPLTCFEAGSVGIDIAVFGFEDQHRPPLSPVTGSAARRMSLSQLEALLAARE